MTTTKIPIGDRLYDLKLVRGRMFINGREHLSFTDHDDECIRVASVVPPKDRPAVVAIAVALAWRHMTEEVMP